MSYHDISLNDYLEIFMSVEPIAYLPLTEPTFYILLSLAPGKKHGYAILKDVKDLSKERVNLSTSTLYTAVGRLLDQELIERLDDNDEDPSPGLPRKSYALTDLGRRVLEAEMVRLQGMLKEARLRLREDGA
jgi:DNA-binding PadR family transcriptional regulator